MRVFDFCDSLVVFSTKSGRLSLVQHCGTRPLRGRGPFSFHPLHFEARQRAQDGGQAEPDASPAQPNEGDFFCTLKVVDATSRKTECLRQFFPR